MKETIHQNFFSLLLCMAVGLTALAGTITVTSTADAGAGSLRQAVSSANSGDTIYFDIFTNLSTIVLTSGEIALDKVLYIEGNGSALTQISGGSSSRIFNVSANVIISSLTATNGSSTSNEEPLLFQVDRLILGAVQFPTVPPA